MSLMTDIAEFHTKFGLQYDGSPRVLEPELRGFRIKFMQEELVEYAVSHTKADELDALVDLVYVALGTAYMQGFDFQAAWDRVHAANMAKVRAESADQSKRSSAFDVVKPEGWVAPDLTDLVGEEQRSLFDNDHSS